MWKKDFKKNKASLRSRILPDASRLNRKVLQNVGEIVCVGERKVEKSKND